MMKAIKLNQSIDYYILYYSKMVTAYFHSIKHVPFGPLANNLYDHLQIVILRHNDDVASYATYLHLKDLGIVSNISEYFKRKDYER